MQKRSLRVVKWLNVTPVIAECTLCGHQFTVPMSALTRTTDAQVNLIRQFDRHKCSKIASMGV